MDASANEIPVGIIWLKSYIVNDINIIWVCITGELRGSCSDGMRNLRLRKLIFSLPCHIYHVSQWQRAIADCYWRSQTTQRRLYTDTFRGRLLLFSAPEFHPVIDRLVPTVAEGDDIGSRCEFLLRGIGNVSRSEFNQTVEVLRKTASPNTFTSLYVQSGSLEMGPILRSAALISALCRSHSSKNTHPYPI